MLFGIDIVWLVFGALIIALLGLIWVWWGITHRGPSIQLEIEHRRAGYRGWEDDNSVPSPRYDLILRWTVIGIGIISITSCGLGAYLMSKTDQSPDDTVTVSIPTTIFDNIPTATPTLFAISTADREMAIITHTPIATITPTTTNTPRATRTPSITEQATLDGTATAYPTYTPYPTLTPHVLIVTPVNQRPTNAPYVPQSQPSSYGRLVPDQRGQSQTVYQQPSQQYYQPPQYQYVYPTVAYVFPRWEDYITSTPIPTSTPAPTQTPYMVVVTSAPIVITNTPEPTFTATMTPAPTQTPHIIIITNTPNPTATETMTNVPTSVPPTATPTSIPPTATDEPTHTPIPPTATLIPTETPMPTATQTPTPTATPEPTSTPIPPTATPEPTHTPTEQPIDEEIIPDEPTDDH